MNTEQNGHELALNGINNKVCPYCGAAMVSETVENLVQCRCGSCGYLEAVTHNENAELDHQFQLYRVSNLVLKKLLDKAEDVTWDEVDEVYKNLGDALPSIDYFKSPLYRMVHAAWLTKGFTTCDASSRGMVEEAYSLTNDYVQKNQDATLIKQLLKRCNKLRNKRKKLFALIFSAVGVVLLSALLMFFFYSPVITDEDSGITVNIPHNAISFFEKFATTVAVEKQPTNASAYIDAKHALRNETEKFELYDLSLTSGNKSIEFDGTVTVKFPIPQGYQASCLKIYHVISDDEYEEIPSTVSVANNTISFTTTHFSFYAIAERHPIVTFDTDNAGEINRQIVKRDTFAQEPQTPEKLGYSFGGWYNNGEDWDFSTDTVKKDIVLTAKWIPNRYTVTLIPMVAILRTTR